MCRLSRHVVIRQYIWRLCIFSFLCCDIISNHCACRPKLLDELKCCKLDNFIFKITDVHHFAKLLRERPNVMWSGDFRKSITRRIKNKYRPITSGTSGSRGISSVQRWSRRLERAKVSLADLERLWFLEQTGTASAAAAAGDAGV